MAARRFGEALGVAFQLQDNYLGVWGQPETLGKAPNDLEERKRSLPVVLAGQEKPVRAAPTGHPRGGGHGGAAGPPGGPGHPPQG